ncbi:MAG TPA: ATP-binding cassette domain-containing protein [Thermoanaerobaculia bacterium]|nr:ATP-binding cassette domain-containing protein [Thermoanaerobaculia bacterium]
MRRAFLIPEVVQTSAADCGPATLKSLLEGFGVRLSYGRLREACQIDLDGTSIDTMEEVAAQLGLEAEQVMVPADFLFAPAARCLPAIVVVRHPNGLTHFVVVWRRHGPFFQVMDPASGRRWTTAAHLSGELYRHRMAVPAAAWREWAGSAEFLDVQRAFLAELRIASKEAEEILAEALADPGWRSLAALDACVRMTRSLVASGGLARGSEAGRLLRSLFSRSREAPEAAEPAVPEAWWSVRPAPAGAEGEEQVLFRGAVLVRVRGRSGASLDAAQLSPELAAALTEPPSRPGRELFRMLAAGGFFAPGAIALALLVAGLGVVVEALLFRSFFDLGRNLGLGGQRAAAIGVLFAVIALFLLLDLPIVRGAQRLGRHLEARLRVAFLRKIPRLGDRYFQSRLTSDMADRSHSVHRLRLVTDFGESFLRAGCELFFTLAGIVWLDPGSLPLVVAAALLSLGVPLVLLPRLEDWDLRVRNHAGAITRFYLDAILGLFPIRTHGAQKAVRRQHESLLVEWARAYLHLRGAEVVADTAVQIAINAIIIALVFEHLARRGLDGSILLLVYWGFKVLTLGHMLILSIATQYPSHRNVALRLLEPLGAPEEPEEITVGVGAQHAAPAPGIGIVWQDVSVRAGGHTILEGIDTAVAPGEHVAIVGPSGAGKSSLVGTLLGWHRPAAGRVLVDGEPVGGERLQALRRETAWVDPAVQLWNRPLLENLRYGSADGLALPIDDAIRQAELVGVLRKLPEGLQTPLGEGGGLVSGGEGQRVRLGRAVLRPQVRLAILDEPFRGLDREQRRELLARSRRLWQHATMLCVTHDVGETLGFARVLVIENGRIVEDGPPSHLAAQPGSRYAALLAAERDVRMGLWESAVWRRLRMERGRLTEAAEP